VLLDPDRAPETNCETSQDYDQVASRALAGDPHEAARKSNWDDRLDPNRGRGIAVIEGREASLAVVIEGYD
jgi:hypothetical protein